ncbi:hypothetical protein PMAYCL1PPCAC_02263, partial [Pristionchus mayeri]
TDVFPFHVTQLLSFSLRDILVLMCKRQMPYQSAMFLTWSSLNVIDALHEVGYIHRDINPYNFAVGSWPNDLQVYILGFGMVHKYVNEKGIPKPPRKKVRFVGNLKYCSRACHEERERSRKDDW